jgi:hypothetical protein
MTAWLKDADDNWIESELIRCWGISSNKSNRALSVTIDEYDILKLNNDSLTAQELIEVSDD